ncbi:flagellar biosynthesis protein FlgA [Actinomyces sp. 2119]|uniref:Flagellar biosynthesis protein FlgA n=1 Tax=Actinomyces lilanjuaniae TaxID=2321394 RepID=A0ABM6Z5L5_9ACTO|nr:MULTISPECIES: SAF domain-containing protein [Actinomyces]AYD90500.1 flagellar biosynthesis protein FlgA [Actinomyces lilanjuaniae]RJF44049.1 flagellar biosynthesis protein FlgA [Actinomyces sp. 2119]
MAHPQDGRGRRRFARDWRGAGAVHAGQGAGAARLPTAPRERRPALAALAVLLILGGALLAGLLALRMGQRTEVLAAAGTIEAGQVITKDDLATTLVASDLSNLVPVDQAEQVIGQTARVEVSQGQLLDTSQVADGPLPGEGKQVVGVSLEAGRFPATGLSPGDVADVVDVNGRDVAVSGVQVLDAVPSSGADGEWTSGAVVSLIVDADDAVELSASAAAGDIAVVVTAPGRPVGED